MHKKDFKEWHTKKESIENRPSSRLFFHEREVWWCALGENIGFEQDGKGKQFLRPVLVFKKFNNEVFWAIPLSTRIKDSRFYFSIKLADNIPRVAILSQLRLIDAKRLVDKIGVVNKESLHSIEKAVVRLCTA